MFSVGRPKHQKVMMGGLEEADVYIGRKAQELRGLLKIKYPVEHGIVSRLWIFVIHYLCCRAFFRLQIGTIWRRYGNMCIMMS